MQFRHWGAGLVLTSAWLASITLGMFHHLSMIGLTKALGPVSGGAGIVLLGVVAIVGLLLVLSIPLTLLLGIIQLFTSARASRFVLFCALSTCMASTANLWFWLFYCGGIPGTAQRPFP